LEIDTKSYMIINKVLQR